MDTSALSAIKMVPFVVALVPTPPVGEAVADDAGADGDVCFAVTLVVLLDKEGEVGGANDFNVIFRRKAERNHYIFGFNFLIYV